MSAVTRPFVHDAFLLESPLAERLFHDYARDLPIIDYHNHLDPMQLARDHRFRSMTELWLDGDHYKWRAQRAFGQSERLLTGDASDWEKFAAWAAVVPETLGNPLHHWTHMELRFPFGIDELLEPRTARAAYDAANAQLAQSNFSALGLLRQFRVEVVATTDDPVDSLEYHQAFAREHGGNGLRLLPTFRPDRALAIEDAPAFRDYVQALSECSGVAIEGYDSLLEMLDRRHAFFHQLGCRLSDHGITKLYGDEVGIGAPRRIFDVVMLGGTAEPAEVAAFRAALLHELLAMNHRRGWVQQLHLGPLRNLNSRQFAALGPNTGFDAMGEDLVARPLASLLDQLDRKSQLAKTIVYGIHPKDTELLATVLGCFQGDVPGKMQLGSAWWFLDQLDGMERQLRAVAQHGLLSQFVGMLTDSRSLLSMSRHEYFRRLVCNLLASDARRGRLPDDVPMLGALVRRLAYDNAKAYFPFAHDG